MITLKSDNVLVKDKNLIEKLRNLGAAIDDENQVKVPLLEAAYLAEKGMLKLKPEDILKNASKKDELAKEKLQVIRHLRDRGYITRVSLENSDFLRLHRKGFRPNTDRTYYLLKVVNEKWKPTLKQLQEDLAFAGKLRKELAIAVVGKQIKFVKFSRTNFE